jgi:hypothetical protein
MTTDAPRANLLRPSLTMRTASVAALTALLFSACTASDGGTATTEAFAGCADVVDGTIEWSGTGYRVTATVRSADTGWDRYADGWEVRAPDGAVLGVRVLTHPHVEEQPFTRSLDGVAIPESTASIEIAARDSKVGFCGETLTLAVPPGR